MPQKTELVLRSPDNMPALHDYDTFSHQFDLAPIALSNLDTATEYMTAYRYALWPASATQPGRIMAEIREPGTSVNDGYGKVYDYSPVVGSAEAVRVFAGWMESPVGPVLRSLGYGLAKTTNPAERATILAVEIPSFEMLTKRAANGLVFENTRSYDENASLVQMDIGQTKSLANRKYSLGGNDEAMMANMIWSAPFVSMVPPELITGLVEMSKATQDIERSSDFDSQHEKGRPAAIIKNFTALGSIMNRLKDALKNEQGIPGVSYSPVDELGWEINGIVTSGGGSLADNGRGYAESMLKHVRNIQARANK